MSHLQRLEFPAEVEVANEVGEMLFELQVAYKEQACNNDFFDGAIHLIDAAVRPWLLDLGEAVLDALLAGAHFEHIGRVAGGRAIEIASRKSKLNADVGENGMDLVGEGCDQDEVEGRYGGPSSNFEPLNGRELAGTINGYIDISSAFSGLHPGNADVEMHHR